MLLLCTLSLSAGFGQSSTVLKPNLAQLAESKGLTIINRTAVPLREANRDGIRLDERDGDGLVWLTGAQFSNGTIELDIRGKDELQKSFVGVAFHGVDENTYESVYFRPFNFRAQDSVRHIHAVQYISQPDFPWEKLRKERSGQYEKALEPAPDPTAWFHTRIEIKAPLVRVFVNNEQKPCLTIQQLTDRPTGLVGLMVGNGSGGDFANLVIRPTP